MKLNEDLTVIKDLGAGAYGQVYLCNYQHDNFSKIVAVKKINKQENIDLVVKEAKINSNLIHPNIIQIYNIEKDFDNNLLLIFEYVEGISLRDYLEKNRNIKTEEALYIFNSLLSGLEYLHKNNVIHHDLSPRNIMLGHHGEVKILDFGLSKIQNEEQNELSEISGSISYYDPYLIQNKKSYDIAADLYSLMLMLYELLTGSRFFPSASPLEILNYLKNFEVVSDEDLEDIEDEHIKSFLKINLGVSREDRYSIEAIKEILKDYKVCAFALDSKLHLKNNLSETVTNIQRTSSKFNFKKISIMGAGVLALVLVIYFSINKKSSSEFYVRENDQIFSASIKDTNKEIKNYSDIGQLFDKKACDYFYYSFITSIVLLDTDYLVKNKTFVSSLESRVNNLERFYQTKKTIDLRCPALAHVQVSKLLDSFFPDFREVKKQKDLYSLEKTQNFKDVLNFFENDNLMIGSFDEASKFLKENFFNIQTLTKLDLYKIEFEKLNIDSCSLFSQLSFINKIVNLKEGLDILSSFKILGLSKKSDIVIHGQFNNQILFEAPHGSNFKSSEYCLYTISKNKASSYFGKLKFHKIK